MNQKAFKKWGVNYRGIPGTDHVVVNSLGDLGCEILDTFCDFASQHQKIVPAFTPISRGW